ncbi:uncharacterized protein LOC132198600 [Neocloeon triangulifer]|uniref:uncharacterized protein LOC132198600 n=1 Tax=Neocloeon triangulifer TaxID=2078957 RepID=UPI00286F4097|nr:uncharacterized protein LOC132198600 [Neocloeon triangulifer]
MQRVRLFLALLLVLAASANAKPADVISPRVTGEEINAYVDVLVEEVKRLIIEQGLEPYMLPDLVRGFSFTDLLGIVWHGEASLTRGNLIGLLTLHRVGDMDITPAGNNLTVRGQLGFTTLQFDYMFEATFMDLGPTGEAIGIIENTRLAFTMVIDLTTGRGTLIEEDFNIADVGKISIDIKGLGFGLNWLAEVFVNLFVDVFKGVIIWLIEDEVFLLLQQAISNIIFGFIFGAVM